MIEKKSSEPIALPIKAYGKAELRDIYGVSRETFNKWLKAIEYLLPHYERNCKTLTPAQVRIVFDEIGTPEEIGIDRKTPAKHP